MVFFLAIVIMVTMTNHYRGVLVGNGDEGDHDHYHGVLAGNGDNILLSTHRSQLAAMEGSRHRPNCIYCLPLKLLFLLPPSPSSHPTHWIYEALTPFHPSSHSLILIMTISLIIRLVLMKRYLMLPTFLNKSLNGSVIISFSS